MNNEKSDNCKDGDSKTHIKLIIAGLIGAILGIMAYTNNWLG